MYRRAFARGLGRRLLSLVCAYLLLLVVKYIVFAAVRARSRHAQMDESWAFERALS